ncbi:hypothetical protein PQR57_11705 [Paraburkholderia dipogonis]|uniref:Uncharacterized protein n=1 Tax=Paraburkholderia dipogonis TaxID=1211383 RepID=A0ABW9AP60_9BURK
MSMFKDAFTQLNSDYGTSSQQLPGTAYAPWLAQSDHAMLTGLADFTGSMTDNPVSSNPMLVNQTDTFSYQVLQSTRTEGNLLDGKISQTQRSHLQARLCADQRRRKQHSRHRNETRQATSGDVEPGVQSVCTTIRIRERRVGVGRHHANEYIGFERSAYVAATFV